MINNYFLVELVENLSGGVDKAISIFDTYKAAESKWRDQLSKKGGNPQTAYGIFEILDPYGRVMGSNYYVVDNTPEVQYTAITDPDAIAEEGVTYYVLINNQYVEDIGISVGDRVFGKYVVAE